MLLCVDLELWIESADFAGGKLELQLPSIGNLASIYILTETTKVRLRPNMLRPDFQMKPWYVDRQREGSGM